MVFYGLMSGIAFGVFEGVQYQITVNAQQTYDVSFFLNIARLTSLPFLHACWCGIAGYFLSFANLYPKYRRGLYTLALCVPAVIHGLYDALSDYWLVSLIMVFNPPNMSQKLAKKLLCACTSMRRKKPVLRIVYS